MIALTILGCIAVFAASLFLFRRELDETMHRTVEVAAMIVENEIEEMKIKAQVAAFGMQSNPDLIQALVNEDRDQIIYLANALKIMTQIDFCNIIDREGYVITRTHAPNNYGDNILNQPHVSMAKSGYSESIITQGAIIGLGVYAGAPVYDDEMNLVGIISLGFRLDVQELAYRLKEITGCDVTIFRGDERVSTTLLDEDGLYALGTTIAPDVVETVLAGETHKGALQLYGNTVLTIYTPLRGDSDNIVGMYFVGYDTSEDESKMQVFITIGLLLTFVVLLVCTALAVPVSGVIKDQLDKMMVTTAKAHKDLEVAYEQNELQLLKLNLMVKASNIGLWDFEVVKDDPFNPTNTHIYSDTYRHMLGYTDESDFPNRYASWRYLVHPDDAERVSNAFKAHLFDKTGKTPFREEYRMLKKDGIYAFYISFCETIRDEEGFPLRASGAMMDITEEKLIQERLRNARDTAEAANRSKSVFLANMSHEIRTPMNSIIGFSELAQDDDVPDKTRTYLSNISENAIWLLSIINDILDNTKIESGKIVLEHIPFNLQDVIDQCQSAILPKTVDKGFTFLCYAEPFGDKKIVGDPVRLRQVLMNLLSNAAKFTSTGSVKLYAHNEYIDDKEATVSFVIKDTGIGMSPEHVANIFDPYMQADDSVTRRFGGTGLGLPISKSIVELMGGELAVESTPGIGSTFSFELTFDLVDDESDLYKAMLTHTEKPSFDAEVLTCEDNALNQQVISNHLSRVGIRTILAENGKEGVDIVKERFKNGEKPFDLIFMDIHMPVMDGLEAATKITEMGIETPIIALTANIMASDVDLYKSSGMLDLVGKPFTSQELWKCLLKYLPVVDYVPENIQERAEKDDKALTQLRVYFAESNITTIAKITDALNDGDIKLAHRLVHTLKSNAGQIGEKKLQKAASDAENILEDGKTRLSQEQVNSLEEQLNKVIIKLRPLTDKTSKPALMQVADDKKILEILNKLEPILKQHSTECMNMLDDIRSIPYSDELARCVDEFEFKKAIIELSALKERLNINDE